MNEKTKEHQNPGTNCRQTRKAGEKVAINDITVSADDKINASLEIVPYEDDERVGSLGVLFGEDTVWLTQAQLAELYQTTQPNIAMHINNIFNSEELDEKATYKNILLVQKEGKREISRLVKHYNLDMIISIGYRVNSKIGIKFRQWATKHLKKIILNSQPRDAEWLEERQASKVAHKSLMGVVKVKLAPITPRGINPYRREAIAINEHLLGEHQSGQRDNLNKPQLHAANDIMAWDKLMLIEDELDFDIRHGRIAKAVKRIYPGLHNEKLLPPIEKKNKQLPHKKSNPILAKLTVQEGQTVLFEISVGGAV